MVNPTYSMTKKCKVCEITKNVSEFRVKKQHLQSIGRYMSICRSCESLIRKTPYKKHLHAIRLKRYEQTEKGTEARRKACEKYRHTISFKKAIEKYRLLNPLKRKAQTALQNAVAHGLVKRPDNCSVCGKKCTPEGHHYDYLKQLDVIWVCKKCHTEYHRG
jgi:hypothetical protein